ncbi:MAG TPA: ankyrin repeat domain-containing protein, partial [Candidatus Babeliales bacterium]|nr:ankyrin repeat domain-containing protein [Candidatus Babeliales bacterium]
DGITALMLAAQHGRAKIVRQLLAAGANPELQAPALGTALTAAALTGHSAIVEKLLRAGANVNAQTPDGPTALIVAAQGGHMAVVQQLLAANALVDQPAGNGATALMMATRNGHLPVVQQLLAAGANVNFQASNGTTALILAALDNRLQIAHALLRAGAAVTATTTRDLSALTGAARAGHIETVQLLLAACAPLSSAQAARLEPEVVDFIHTQYQLVQNVGDQFVAAMKAGDLATATDLITLPACQHRSLFDYAVLFANCRDNWDDALFAGWMQLLSAVGADLNHGDTVIMNAPSESTALAAAAPPTAVLRALDLAIQHNRPTRVRVLIELGANPLLLADTTSERLAAFTLNTPATMPAERAAELAHVRALRQAELQSTTELTPEEQAVFLDNAFTIAQLMSDEIIKPSLEQRLMAQEDRDI